MTTETHTPKAIEPHGRGKGRTAVDISDPHKDLLLRLGGVRYPKPSVGGTAAHLLRKLLDDRPEVAAELLAVTPEELLAAAKESDEEA